MPAAPPPPGRLGELAAVFLRLGLTAFGGPAAHVAMMEAELVGRRRWLDAARFLDLVGATALVPGPNSTELAILIGRERAGWRGLLVAGACFILPAALLTAALAAAYVRWGALPEVGWLLRGVKPVVVAVILQAAWNLAPRAARTPALRAVGLAVVAGALLGAPELALLLAAGVAAVLARRPAGAAGLLALPAGPGAWPLAAAALPAGASAATPAGLFAAFLWIGSVLFGSGYVLVAFLRAELVLRLGWLTEAQLLDAVAAGQVTPGPVFSTATFVGWILAGPAGAAAATLGIFLPAFLVVAALGPLLDRLRAPGARAFLDGVNVASLALMGVAAARIAGAAVVDGVTAALCLASAVALVRWRVNATWLIAGGAAVAWVAR